MFRLILIIASLLASLIAAPAQVRQSGSNVTPGHAAYWVTNGLIGDAGTAANGFLTSLGVTNNGGPGICVNSAATTGPYNQLCMSVSTAAAAQITLQNFGGATAQALQFNINGTISSFVTATGSFTANNVACFQSSAGTLIDCGMTVVGGVVSGGTWNGTPVSISFGGTGGTTASTARSGLGLGSMATQDSSAVAVTGGSITGMPSPTNASDVAIKSYVDATSAGLHVLSPSRLATAAVLPNTPSYANGASGVGATLTAGSNTTLTTDGTVAALNDIVLVKNQASALQNGIYYVSTAGSGAAAWVLTRCTAAACGTQFNNAATMLAGSYTFISAGATNANTSWVLSTTVTTVGTDAANFYIFSNANSGVTSINALGGVWTTTQPITNVSNALVFNATIVPQGRITLNSNTPVMTASYAAQTTVYYTPYVGNLISIYDGTNFIPTQFAELSAALGSNWSASTLYDWYVGSDSGTLRLCTGPAWSSSALGTSTRGTGAGTTELAMTRGVQLNANTMTCRYSNASTFSCAANTCTYVGTMRTGSAGQTNYIFGAAASGGSAANFGIWNMYNRVRVATRVTDSGAAYTYTSGTIRQSRASAGNQVTFIVGMPEEGVSASMMMQTSTSGALGAQTGSGAGFDSTTAFDPMRAIVFAPTANAYSATAANSAVYNPTIGLHVISMNEIGDGVNANTYNSNALGNLNVILSQ